MPQPFSQVLSCVSFESGYYRALGHWITPQYAHHPPGDRKWTSLYGETTSPITEKARLSPILGGLGRLWARGEELGPFPGHPGPIFTFGTLISQLHDLGASSQKTRSSGWGWGGGDCILLRLMLQIAIKLPHSRFLIGGTSIDTQSVPQKNNNNIFKTWNGNLTSDSSVGGGHRKKSTQLTTLYNCGVLKNISESPIPWLTRQMGLNSKTT